MVAIDQFSRRIIGIEVHQGEPNGVIICCMVNIIISGKSPPKYISSDNDPHFKFHRWLANLRIREIEEIKTIPMVPLSHPFIERLIRTIRNELLDQILFWNATDLKRKLERFSKYYNENRSHYSLDAMTPKQKTEALSQKTLKMNQIKWQSYCNGLFQLPVAA